MKNKIVRRLALLLSVVMLITSTVNTSFAYIVTRTDSLVNTFTPGDIATPGSVTINKTVEHPFGDTCVIPDNIAFGFKVELGEDYADKTVHTSAGDMTASANGNLSVDVMPGVPFVLEGIKEGTYVIVTELTERVNPGFTVKEGLPITQMGTVSTTGLTFDFINVYTPESVSATNVSVVGEKILTGRDWREGDVFLFKLEQKMGDDWLELGTETISYDAANGNFNEFDFTDIVQSTTFEEAGTYEFRMTEVAGSEDGMDYDESINTFEIVVTDTDMDGKLEIGGVSAGQNATVAEDNGHYTVSVVFNNSFVPALPDPDDIEVEIAVDKQVNNTGTATMGLEGFAFVLTNDADPTDTRGAESDENGDAAFVLTFTKDDIGHTYDYTLTETDGGVAGMTYDESEYHVSVAVTRDDATNTLVAAVTMTLEGEAVTEGVAAFTNTYHADLPPAAAVTVPVRIEKTVQNTGVSSIGPGGFTFVLEDMESHNKLLTESGENGDAAFELTFTEDDTDQTYTYTLYERDTGMAGVTYSALCYEIVVAVTKDAVNNKMVAHVTQDGMTVDTVEAAFENVYHVEQPDPEPITVPVTVNKTVKKLGLSTISPEGFAFVLENTETYVKLTQKTDAEGKTVFALPFTVMDVGKTCTYTLSETDEGMAGVTYDKTVHTVTVTISEDTVNNKLIAAITMDGQTVEAAVAEFENTYRAVGGGSADDDSGSTEIDPDKDDVESSETGDHNRLNFWFMMMILSGIATVALLFIDRKYAKVKQK